ncbi:hypothetical protein [uncultured Corynebacterium sp.]|uniref:hypothetical protein n=1 Tax=uncultured Corynebacterium sp. TaxID=159447 RepID=UPI0025CF9F0E|nr:hypothetical protein [uncultured Corynebacterium sp.]
MRKRSGLARITSTPADPGYHAGQFLGPPPPTVPAVLDRRLFSTAPGAVDASGAQPVAPPRSAR